MNRIAFSLVISLFLFTFAWADESDLVWSTFVGNSKRDEGNSITVDRFGNVYVAGYTRGSNWPTTTGAYDSTFNGPDDGVVFKLNSAGNTLLYSTFLGGEEYDSANSIAVDDSGFAYITGHTSSADFPITDGAFDTLYTSSETTFINREGFLAKLHYTGNSLVYSTFLGGNDSQGEKCLDVDIDNEGCAYVTGYTTADDFPITHGAYDTIHTSRGHFITKFNSSGSDLDYSTFLDCYFVTSIAVDVYHNAYVTGGCSGGVIVFKLNSEGNAAIFNESYGGSSGQDSGYDIYIDQLCNVYVTGGTLSRNFPTTPGAFCTTHNDDGDYGDAFVFKLDATGHDLIFSTFLGGSNWECGKRTVVDDSGYVYVIGTTTSRDFPVTPGAFDETFGSYNYKIFLAKLNFHGSSLLYSTYFSGTNDDYFGDAKLDDSGNIYLTGCTFSGNFPTTEDVFDNTYNGSGDAFVSKFSLNRTDVIDPESHFTTPPQSFYLHQNYPNPFNACTEIRYRLLYDSYVSLKIYNSVGQEVRTIVAQQQKANEYSVFWNGLDDFGQDVASGLYFCQLKALNIKKTIKILLLK